MKNITHTALGIAGLVQPYVECWSGEPGPQCPSLHTAVHSQLIPPDPFPKPVLSTCLLLQILSGLRGCCKAPALSATPLSSERQCREVDGVCGLLRTLRPGEGCARGLACRGEVLPVIGKRAGVISQVHRLSGTGVICKRLRADSPVTEVDVRPLLPCEKHYLSSVLSSSLNKRPIVSRNRMVSCRDVGEGPCGLTGFHPNLGLDLRVAPGSSASGGHCTNSFQVSERAACSSVLQAAGELYPPTLV